MNDINVLGAHHAQNIDTCKWVLENTDENTDNLTVQLWIKSCKEYLENSIIDNNKK